VISELIVSIIGNAVIEPDKEPKYKESLPQRSSKEECMLKMSAGNASLEGILPKINDI
jgi:hypothetical protein